MFEVDWIKTQEEVAHHKPSTCTSLIQHRLTLNTSFSTFLHL